MGGSKQFAATITNYYSSYLMSIPAHYDYPSSSEDLVMTMVCTDHMDWRTVVEGSNFSKFRDTYSGPLQRCVVAGK